MIRREFLVTRHDHVLSLLVGFDLAAFAHARDAVDDLRARVPWPSPIDITRAIRN